MFRCLLNHLHTSQPLILVNYGLSIETISQMVSQLNKTKLLLETCFSNLLLVFITQRTQNSTSQHNLMFKDQSLKDSMVATYGLCKIMVLIPLLFHQFKLVSNMLHLLRSIPNSTHLRVQIGAQHTLLNS